LCPPLCPTPFSPAFQAAFLVNERWLKGVHFLADAPKDFLVQLSLAFVAKVQLSLLPPSSFLLLLLSPCALVLSFSCYASSPRCTHPTRSAAPECSTSSSAASPYTRASCSVLARSVP
jgi:hypothetical protein